MGRIFLPCPNVLPSMMVCIYFKKETTRMLILGKDVHYGVHCRHLLRQFFMIVNKSTNNLYFGNGVAWLILVKLSNHTS